MDLTIWSIRIMRTIAKLTKSAANILTDGDSRVKTCVDRIRAKDWA